MKNKTENAWEWALFTFGLFMVMMAPTVGTSMAMIFSGLFFAALALILIMRKKKKGGRK